jgi:group II intron reverse transcriptase/maturase
MRESNRPEAAAATKAERQHKWYSLYDKVYNPGNLALAWELVRANKGAAGVDGESIEDFERELPENLQRLHEELRGKTYRPEPVRRVYIPKPDGRQRPLGIPAVRDRVVQQALRNKLEPIFEPEFLECSYGFRPGRSAHMALDQITAYLDEGYTWVVDLDLKSYFDTIPHDRLIDCVAAKVSDGSVLRLTRAMLEAGVMESGVVEDSETGTPQGGVISPLLANLYLHRFDIYALPTSTFVRPMT